MRPVLVLSILFVCSSALADTLKPGIHLFPGRPSIAPRSASASSGHAQKGIRVPKKGMIASKGTPAPVSVGRPVTIRGRMFTPVFVRQPTDLIARGNGGVLLAPEPPPVFPKKLAIISHSQYLTRMKHLDAFVQSKTAHGWEVITVDEKQWNPTTLVGQAAADALRGWLRDNYLTQGIGYVLLIGNPDPTVGLVPMKLTWPLKYLCELNIDPTYCEMQSVPTDFYFSDLSGNWDLDGNGFAGEYPADVAEGGVDFGPEVIVGRIPVSSSPEWADTMLDRASKYEGATDLTGRNRVLVASSLLGLPGLDGETGVDDGALSMTTVASHLADLDKDLVFTRMFEAEGVAKSKQPNDYPISQDHLIKAFAYGHGLAVWYAHGYPTSAARMVWTADKNHNGKCESDEYADRTLMESFQLDGIYPSGTPAFLWEISCLNGFPELEFNLGSMMLHMSTVGSVAATRSAFGEDNSGVDWQPSPDTAGAETMAYYWAEQMAGRVTSGEALAYTKYAVPSQGWDDIYPPGWVGYSLMGMGLHGKFNFNLLGDPTLVWERQAGPHDPDWPPTAHPDAGVEPDAAAPGQDAEAPPGPDAAAPGADVAIAGLDASAPYNHSPDAAASCPKTTCPCSSGNEKGSSCSSAGGGLTGLAAFAFILAALLRRRADPRGRLG